MKVSELMNPKGVLLYAKIDNSADALGILVELQEGIGVITNGNAYYNAVSYRETFGGTTAIGGGIALPHAYILFPDWCQISPFLSYDVNVLR